MLPKGVHLKQFLKKDVRRIVAPMSFRLMSTDIKAFYASCGTCYSFQLCHNQKRLFVLHISVLRVMPYMFQFSVNVKK